MQVEKSLTPSMAAKQIGITHSLVCLYCREGRLPAKKVHDRWFIDPDDLQRFAAQERKRGNPDFREK